MIDPIIEQTTGDIPTELLLLSDPSEAVIAEYIGSCTKFVARLNTRIVGVLLLLKTRPRTLEIMNISVYQEYQNKGIGKKLIYKAIEFARDNKATTLDIGTGNPGVFQLLLYQKCGFRIVGVEFDYFRKNHPERIYDNGIECRDMIRLQLEL